VTASPDALALVAVAARAAADKLADNIVAFDVSDQLVITDAFVICSAANDRQVVAIVDAIEDQARIELGQKPVRREGDRDARWVLLDFVDVVVHVQHVEERVYYSLERIWKDCPVIPLPADVVAGGSR
jgi:ribosome-associated protein